ncbi:hypothetical protein G6F70_008520 [Rhizopus microsporus]|uniref:Uncharacterized protein n=1 Tax=Rhizopus azygosporus TaxID=86630 RepID=A0A367JGA4_RHIAZ|nr:hypothetical protein G6F71_008372 [Rhizopus microsporus]RCH88905.1 hypothetical protein CU097_003059 [Rhizopus azygosporus]KAG1195070.1 hypothetical protein G6F70_008520 [Rhizopus microsporus]KAG1205544.1 hypothetical protein G6F69_009367 [Rhizopus microsporus]KAG1224892.1 hypothetical protein G6F67_009419 [Rhizopus microsporus]
MRFIQLLVALLPLFAVIYAAPSFQKRDGQEKLSLKVNAEIGAHHQEPKADAVKVAAPEAPAPPAPVAIPNGENTHIGDNIVNMFN